MNAFLLIVGVAAIIVAIILIIVFIRMMERGEL